MTTNSIYNHFGETTEQDILEELTIESIQSFGYDFIYLPRTLVEIDDLYGEEKISEFDNAITLEMYIESTQGFEGEGELFAKFDFELNDTIRLLVAKSRFEEETVSLSLDRPQEGDLIYFPMAKSLFTITFVEHENPFYQRGKLYSYALSCELFEYSQEKFDTGNATIDSIDDEFLNDDNISNDVNADNNELETEGNEWQDFTESNPFGSY